MNNFITKFSKISFFLALLSIEYLATTTISIQVVENSWDKLNHFIAFFVLYILFSLGYTQLKLINKTYILMLLAIQIEIVQYFIPNRYFSLLDIFADGIGIVIGILVFKLMSKLYEK